jgi:hypothetical protein|eukprot:COSAG02_NODE_8562_length_2523_cov_1.619224_3_plen_127_part_00
MAAGKRRRSGGGRHAAGRRRQTKPRRKKRVHVEGECEAPEPLQCKHNLHSAEESRLTDVVAAEPPPQAAPASESESSEEDVQPSAYEKVPQHLPMAGWLACFCLRTYKCFRCRRVSFWPRHAELPS